MKPTYWGVFLDERGGEFCVWFGFWESWWFGWLVGWFSLVATYKFDILFF